MDSKPQRAPNARFVTGSTMRHVIVMTATGSIGLIAVFIVDALNLFYISLLGIQELAAAIGFASTLLFFTISVAIGFTIACSALVARCLGRGNRDEAARMAGASMVFMGLTTAAMTLAIWPFLRELAALLGAQGETLDLTTRFLQMVLPSTPLVALGMCTTGILRGVGDARRAMYVTLGAAVAAAILDPILIFGLDLGIDGAAISTVLSRAMMLAIGIHGAHVVHHLIKLPDRERLVAAFRPFFSIGVPAVLTQIATPVGNAYVTTADRAVRRRCSRRLGDYRPHRPGRLRCHFRAFRRGRSDSRPELRRPQIRPPDVDHARQPDFSPSSMCWWYGRCWRCFPDPIAALFGAKRQTHDLIVFFCMFAAGSFLFNGAIFVSSAAFNNLGFPTYSTVFNWGRSTLGVIPFVWAGAHYYGAHGVHCRLGTGRGGVRRRLGDRLLPGDRTHWQAAAAGNAASLAAAVGTIAVLHGQDGDTAIALVVSRGCRCACAGFRWQPRQHASARP